MQRSNNFDLLRLLLAILVFYSHSYLLLGSTDPVSQLTRGQIEGGELAVNFFFVLSGTLITRSWLNSRSLGDFLKKRIIRIYPGYLAAVLLCIYAIGPLAAGDPSAYLGQVRPLGSFCNALLLGGIIAPSVFGNQFSHYINGSLWTIPYEFGCYLAVAALGLTGLLKKNTQITTGLLFATLFGIYITKGCQSGLPSWALSNGLAWTRLLMYFAAGSFLSSFPKPFFCSQKAFALGLFGLLVASQAGQLRLLLPWVGAYCFFGFGYWVPTQYRLPKPRVDISYGIYLYAYPLQQLLIKYGVRSPSALNLTCFPLVVGMGLFSWYLVELPAIRRMRKVGRVPVSPEETGPP